MKKRIFSILTAITLFSSQVFAADGFWYEAQLYTSVRDAYTELGYDVEWDAENAEAVIDTGESRIELPKNADYIIIDGVKVPYEHGAQDIIEGRMFAPAEFIAQSLNTALEYDEESGYGIINANGGSTYISTALIDGEDEESGDIDWSAGRPWVTSNLKETIDTNVSLKDDFAMAVTGLWVLDNDIPAGSSARYPEVDAEEEIQENIKTILTTAPQNHEEELLQQVYTAVTDEAARSESLKDEKQAIEEIADISTIDELNEYLIDMSGDNAADIFMGVGVSPDIYNAGKYALYLSPPNLSLGDSTEYEDMSDYVKERAEIRKELCRKIMTHLGFDAETADTYFDNSLKWEALFADVIPPLEELQSPDAAEKYCKRVDLADIYERAGGFPLEETLKTDGFDKSDAVYMYIDGYADKLAEIYTQDNLELMKSKMITSMLSSDMLYLDMECINYYNDAIKALTGMEPASMEDYAIDAVKNTIPLTLAKAYFERFGDKQLKDEVTELCKKCIEEYKLMLAEEDWLSEETRKKAVEKLDNMAIKVGWPDSYTDMSDLDFTGCSYKDILDIVSDIDLQNIISWINADVNKSEWHTDPLVSNAYYEPDANTITILWPEIMAFYSKDMGIEELYAGIGATTIGHEISHAFDPSGSLYDKDGSLNSWWTDEDKAAFDNKAQKLIDYYDTIQPYAGAEYSGDLVQGEAIADMGGMQCMLRLAKKHPNFDYDAFFRAYAKAWEMVTYPQTEYYYCLYDEHPLGYLRINVTIQQFDEFIDTYGLKEGDGMYLAPENRIKVW
ncbi:MAG: hypothetical protein IJL89_00500 [Firmicutes bacterium]|nr:hypothetical protein [Bacillota bacterium]